MSANRQRDAISTGLTWMRAANRKYDGQFYCAKMALTAIRRMAANGPTELPSRLRRLAVGPERTRISCHAALDMAACAAFRKESRMKFANATNLDRKSGVAQWRDLRFPVLTQTLQPLRENSAYKISPEEPALSLSNGDD
jgi:hypothetical protein